MTQGPAVFLRAIVIYGEPMPIPDVAFEHAAAPWNAQFDDLIAIYRNNDWY